MTGKNAALDVPALIFSQATSIRDGFGAAMVELGKTNPQVVALTADLTEPCRLQRFAENHPDRFFQMGISENDMIGTAAGLAINGYVPFATTFSVFATSLANQPVRLSVAYNNCNVKIAVSHGGITVGADGATHQSFEDVGIMRLIPDMVVVVPADANEAYEATLAAAAHIGPVFIRLSRSAVEPIAGRPHAYSIGPAYELRSGRDVALFACGPMVDLTLKAAQQLSELGISATVVNVPTIKPLDRETILSVAETCAACVSVEEHTIIGGLGGALAELLSEELPTPLQRVGVRDTFGESGEPDEILKRYGLTVDAVVAAAHTAIDKKRSR
jgi:transketolase